MTFRLNACSQHEKLHSRGVSAGGWGWWGLMTDTGPPVVCGTDGQDYYSFEWQGGGGLTGVSVRRAGISGWARLLGRTLHSPTTGPRDTGALTRVHLCTHNPCLNGHLSDRSYFPLPAPFHVRSSDTTTPPPPAAAPTAPGQEPAVRPRKRCPGSEWQWWKFVEGASWQHPHGPASEIKDKMDHPVVCVTHEDALEYCKWARKRLPTEAEWERAARGGLDHKLYIWGDERHPKGEWLANVFQGEFPHKNTGDDGYFGTAPVKTFPANKYGLHDMAGNVWEHCSDLYRPEYFKTYASQTKLERNPKGPKDPISQPMAQQYVQAKKYTEGEKPFHKLAWLWVTKGGSHLCHQDYCLRYRPASRHYSESLSPTNHTGFRCAKSK